MSEPKAATPPNKWTLMFFIAGDNDLSPLMVSELKSIKAAGFQRDTTVLVHFDPQEARMRTRVFNVNHKAKEKDKDKPGRGLGVGAGTVIGDGNDPYIHHLTEDDVPGFGKKKGKGAVQSGEDGAEAGPGRRGVAGALTRFLNFCVDEHSASHYMLFLVGHGMIVGNDTFLPDEHPVSSVSLKTLQAIMGEFSARAQEKGGAFELLGLHSCSMSSVEVAYQLKGTANYMMATQGTSYVGTWPYRKLLIKTFNAVEGNRADKPREVQALMNSIFDLSLHSGEDFTFAGYSSDLSLCSLDPDTVTAIAPSLQALVAQLKKGLKDERIKDLILLAHWKAQSYWQENYTDLYDFCKCLGDRCDPKDEGQAEIRKACEAVKALLYPEATALVLRSRQGGPQYQYSHGLSIYFPWSRPIEPGDEEEEAEEAEQAEQAKPASKADAKAEDEGQGVIGRYRKYAFTEDLGADSWLSFLEVYFDETKRKRRETEEAEEAKTAPRARAAAAAAGPNSKVIRQSFNLTGPFFGGFNLDRARFNSEAAGALAGPGKSGSALTGPGKSGSAIGGCSCPSIKNYPLFEDENSPAGKKPARPSKRAAKKASKRAR